MEVTIEAESPPLKKWADGSLRVGNTRVTLDTLIAFYNQGENAEQLAKGFPTIALADIHATIAYYLKHRAQIDAYLAERTAAAAGMKSKVEKQFPPEGIRDRLLDRLSKKTP